MVASVSGSPIVSATTRVDGRFTITNAPCGTNIPLVIQLGLWRRQITIPSVACCANTALTNSQTHLPRNRLEGDIPSIAVVTGSADAMECILPLACTPRTSCPPGLNCGSFPDGCGGSISCGVCIAPATCGGGGVPSVCGRPGCTPRTRTAGMCGLIGDGSEGTVNCGACTPPDTCGGGGVPACADASRACARRAPREVAARSRMAVAACSIAGLALRPTHAAAAVRACVDTGIASPRRARRRWTTCAAAGVNCGPAGDGCGGAIDCGMCIPPDTCGGGGTPSRCGRPPCVPTNCAAQNANCGPIGDGCGGTLDCGVCNSSNCGACAPVGCTCGGGGIPSRCGCIGQACGPQRAASPPVASR